MPWRCPACNLPIRHSDIEHEPRPGATYRCHICRLELIVDAETHRLTVAPIADAADKVKKPRRGSSE